MALSYLFMRTVDTDRFGLVLMPRRYSLLGLSVSLFENAKALGRKWTVDYRIAVAFEVTSR